MKLLKICKVVFLFLLSLFFLLQSFMIGFGCGLGMSDDDFGCGSLPIFIFGLAVVGLGVSVLEFILFLIKTKTELAIKIQLVSRILVILGICIFFFGLYYYSVPYYSKANAWFNGLTLNNCQKSDNPSECFFDLSKRTREIEYCSYITEVKYSDLCYWYMGGEPGHCEIIENNTMRDECHSAIACGTRYPRGKKNNFGCDMINNTPIKEKCYLNCIRSLEFERYLDCNNITDVQLRDNCWYNLVNFQSSSDHRKFIMDKEGISYCDRIENNTHLLGLCYKVAALYYRNESMCNGITTDWVTTSCHKEVTRMINYDKTKLIQG